METPSLGAGFSSSIQAVSYTHLDVYKRQLKMVSEMVCEQWLPQEYGLPLL